MLVCANTHLASLCVDREGVEFATAANRPSEYEIMGCYPQQSRDTIQKFSRQIARLVAETSLTKAPHRSLPDWLITNELFMSIFVVHGSTHDTNLSPVHYIAVSDLQANVTMALCYD